jgi:hypothetical protein
MDNREVNAQKHTSGRVVPTQRLPYRSPVLVEYGNVSKLTEGATGSMADSAAMTTGRPCL